MAKHDKKSLKNLPRHLLERLALQNRKAIAPLLSEAAAAGRLRTFSSARLRELLLAVGARK